MSITIAKNTIEARYLLDFSDAADNPFSLDVDLTLPGKGITAIFGESGSGKTTLLRCIAGLQKVRQGRLVVNGDVWQDEQTVLPTHSRSLGYVFQEASLFPHLTARANLTYAIKRSGSEKSLVQYEHVVSLMAIEPILDQYPSQLSGGERQRVAIARALLINPRLLLMDEPLASLDVARKQEILPYLASLRKELDIPVFYVSHAVDEVARLADYLVVMDRGRVVADGAVADMLSRIDLPVRFGEDAGVVLDATVVERDTHWHLIRARFSGGEMWLRDGGDAINETIRLRILARDVSLALEVHEDTSILNRLHAEVVEIVADADPAMSMVRMNLGTNHIVARLTRRSVDHLQLTGGSKVWAQIKSVAVVR